MALVHGFGRWPIGAWHSWPNGTWPCPPPMGIHEGATYAWAPIPDQEADQQLHPQGAHWHWEAAAVVLMILQERVGEGMPGSASTCSWLPQKHKKGPCR